MCKYHECGLYSLSLCCRKSSQGPKAEEAEEMTPQVRAFATLCFLVPISGTFNHLFLQLQGL